MERKEWNGLLFFANSGDENEKISIKIYGSKKSLKTFLDLLSCRKIKKPFISSCDTMSVLGKIYERRKNRWLLKLSTSYVMPVSTLQQ